jgi:hypothetical protein
MPSVGRSTQSRTSPICTRRSRRSSRPSRAPAVLR